MRAKHVVACWNRVTAHISRPAAPAGEGPLLRPQGALIYGRGAQQLAGFKDANIGSISRAATACSGTARASRPGAFGSYEAAGPPTSPRCSTSPSSRAITTRRRSCAYEGGRKKLLEMSARDLEKALIDVIDRTVNKEGGDFEPQRDITRSCSTAGTTATRTR